MYREAYILLLQRSLLPAFEVSVQNFVLFQTFFTFELLGSLYSNSVLFTLIFVFNIDIYKYYFHIFIFTTIRPFKFDKLSAINATTIEQKITLICYVFILLFFGKICIRFCSDPVFHIRSKALAVAVVFDIFVGCVPCNC